eukprot:TRINITY_DN32930_c0_g1_i1.p2 TRINITY_DN32930_c0_g1~~TRINITY_DN32930_c0_g1_i1.p2  ORF type:complete len:194 (+),score=56.82 TRINITY_DN32930_c0_g1_i1:91-672(+)
MIDRIGASFRWIYGFTVPGCVFAVPPLWLETKLFQQHAVQMQLLRVAGAAEDEREQRLRDRVVHPHAATHLYTVAPRKYVRACTWVSRSRAFAEAPISDRDVEGVDAEREMGEFLRETWQDAAALRAAAELVQKSAAPHHPEVVMDLTPRILLQVVDAGSAHMKPALTAQWSWDPQRQALRSDSVKHTARPLN